MKFIIIIIISMIAFLYADEYSDFQQKQKNEIKDFELKTTEAVKENALEYERFKVLTEKEYSEWKEKEEREISEFKKSIEKQWGSFEEPSNKNWVEYSKDLKSVTTVDFEKGVVSVKILKTKGEDTDVTISKLTNTIERVLVSKGSQTSLPVETSDKSLQISQQPILAGQVVSRDGKSDADAAKILKEQIKNVVKTPIKNGDEECVVFTFNLTPDHLKKRIQPILPFVIKYCQKYNVEPAHILATIHTESFFNPAARSSCGAIGLMQLMPASGGAEAYAFVYKKDLVPSESYLYNVESNIELGCAYVNLLQMKYFKNVEDKVNRTYCAVAGYNTGPGNVAFAVTGMRKLGVATIEINKLSNKMLYSKLANDLPYVETRNYLKMVVKRMDLYR